MMGMGLGFSRAWTLEALKNCDGDPDRAVDWMFSHEEPQDTPVQQQSKLKNLFYCFPYLFIYLQF